MTPRFKSRARELLYAHEGKKTHLYKCSANKWTIGVGYNIEDRGLPDSIIEMLLSRDIEDIYNALYNKYFWFKDLTENRQLALVDMAFMGVARFAEFTKMISALRVHDYKTAAQEMLDSKWARQVGQRAFDLAKMMIEG